MLFAISWIDHAVIVGYLAGTILIGLIISRKQKTDEEYFLAGRSMPWFVVGLSLFATLTSSLTYLSSPGEIWKSSITFVLGKLMALPLEAVIAFFFLIPFLMRFRFTSAYQYLGFRFGMPARRVGEGLFTCLVISWMGFVVLATSRAISHVAEIQLEYVIATVGVVATLYTVLGGFRAVIWTEVMQVALMLGGALVCILYVAVTTGTGPQEWFRASEAYQAQNQKEAIKIFSIDPTERATVITVMLSMASWYLCTHVGNQMAVQRYFATTNLKKAWKSFITAATAGVILNVLLATTGLAILYFYTLYPGRLPVDFNPRGGGSKGPDNIFPNFMKEILPPGLAGAVLAAVMSAAMSTIDSGINAVATILTVGRDKSRKNPGESHVGTARWITALAGIGITFVAFALDPITRTDNIVGMMPRTFNVFVAPMGGMFLVGIFLPHVGGRAILPAALIGLAASILMGFSKAFFGVEISFNWIIPGALLAVIVSAAIFGLLDRPLPSQVQGLTWWSRNQAPKIDPELIAPAVIKVAAP